MTQTIRTMAGGALALAVAFGASLASAQDEEAPVARKTDWSVFVSEEPEKICWIVSAPKETVNMRDGRIVAVRRGEILLFVSFRPSDDVAGEVSFTGGYPFAEGSTVSMQVSDATYELYVENRPDQDGGSTGYAWAADPGEDRKIITSMKRGAEAVLTARSTRGTTTEDTFSLFGFTAAMEEAERRCSS